MFQLSIDILPYHDFPLEKALQEMSRLGYKSVNLWSAKKPLPDHVNPGDDPKAIRALLDRYGMYPNALSIYGKTQEEMSERIEFAGQLGIDTVIFDAEANFGDFVHSIVPPLLDVAKRNGVRIAVENHLTVPFTEDFETGGHEEERWEEGVDTIAQIKRLVSEIDDPNLGICLAPPHLWIMGETISEAIYFLAERKKLFYFYIWDISRNYKHGVDGLNFGPGEEQRPQENGVLDQGVLLRTLKQVGYEGMVDLLFHGTAGWPLEKVSSELADSTRYVRSCMDAL